MFDVANYYTFQDMNFLSSLNFGLVTHAKGGGGQFFFPVRPPYSFKWNSPDTFYSRKRN